PRLFYRCEKPEDLSSVVIECVNIRQLAQVESIKGFQKSGEGHFLPGFAVFLFFLRGPRPEEARVPSNLFWSAFSPLPVMKYWPGDFRSSLIHPLLRAD